MGPQLQIRSPQRLETARESHAEIRVKLLDLLRERIEPPREIGGRTTDGWLRDVRRPDRVSSNQLASAHA